MEGAGARKPCADRAMHSANADFSIENFSDFCLCVPPFCAVDSDKIVPGLGNTSEEMGLGRRMGEEGILLSKFRVSIQRYSIRKSETIKKNLF